MHGTKALAEADRLMVVCNSCRYCEGLCAVFPAMELRRAFPDGDLNYLANLCHGCGACYDDCQFSPPHEFNVNVPKIFAQVRADSYRAYTWPAALSGLFDRNGRAIAIIAALSVAVFAIGFVAFDDRAALFASHGGPGAFYALMPHGAMAWVFSAAFLYAIVALALGARNFWRDIAEPLATLAEPPAPPGGHGRLPVALSRRRRRRLHERRRKPCRSPPAVSPFHLLRISAVLRRHLRGDALSLPAGARGALSVVRPAGRARHRRRHRAHDRTGRTAARQMAARSRNGG
jgi:ferredoxin